VPGLKCLHEYGFLPANSQPFDHEICAHGGQVHENMQRPYLAFTMPTVHPQMPKEKVATLVHSLLVHQKVYAVIYSDFDKYPSKADLTDLHTVKPLHNADELYQFRSSYTSNDGSPILDDQCVTKSRSAETEAGLPETNYKEYTHMLGSYRDDLPSIVEL
jgi:hypothetical protein